MTTFVPKDVQAGLDSARLAAMKSASRLRLCMNGTTYPVLRMWKTGFSMDAATAPRLRGYADLHDGAIHLFRCLIVTSEEEAGEARYEFKRLTAVTDKAALDFEKAAAEAPVALIEDAR
jgi:hypothetical protein